eukprot:jgi/Undpi1/5495/HiC_scaffold_2.g00774.m1
MGDSRVRLRSSYKVGPYGALLIMASLFQCSSAAGSFEGGRGNNAPARPPTSSSERHHRHSNRGGRGGERQQPPPGALSPEMYTRVPQDETDARGARTEAEAGAAWDDGGRESHGGRGGVDGGGGGDVAAGHRQQAFSAAGRGTGRGAALEHRAGAGAGGGRGEGGTGGGPRGRDAFFLEQQQQQQQQRQEADQSARGDPWDATALAAPGQGTEGAGSAERGLPGQAIGTQQRSSSLFRRAGGGGVFFIFVILVCRSLNSYEHADQQSGMFRAVMMVPAVSLFLGNLVCMCLSLVQSATNKQKARMKTMLTVDAAAEGVLLMYNLLCLLRGSGYIPREEFVSRMLGNVLFLSLCFTFAKARWVADGAF